MEDLIIKEKIINGVIGTGIPKPGDNQNTDIIIPADFLLETTFEGFGEYAFYNERLNQGEKHPFNNPKYQGGKILVVGDNFGSGSSREHAPQALKRYGIEAIIAKNFAGIFADNCTAIGIVGITAEPEIVNELLEYIEEEPSTKIGINLENKIFTYNNHSFPFDISDGIRKDFLKGTWEALTVLSKNEQAIRKVEEELPYLDFE